MVEDEESVLKWNPYVNDLIGYMQDRRIDPRTASVLLARASADYPLYSVVNAQTFEHQVADVKTYLVEMGIPEHLKGAILRLAAAFIELKTAQVLMNSKP